MIRHRRQTLGIHRAGRAHGPNRDVTALHKRHSPHAALPDPDQARGARAFLAVLLFVGSPERRLIGRNGA